jgi:serine/threonine protein kinase
MERLLRKGNALEITAADWALLSPLVDEALDLAPKQRGEWLEASEAIRTLAPAQRAQLDLLIAQSNEPETEDLFATLPQFGLKAHRYVDTFARGDRVGPYTLVEKIGTGGMSEVWRAYRSDGAYEREVALKLPYAHASVASREHFIRRMERERDLLARLEHPNIARFYDAGIAKTELGAQPYLALEYVNGQSITEYANSQKLTIDSRCKLFMQVLDAVQYAHQRFVVHRDLKPSNILVRTSGPMNGQVALLDFGIAKVLDEETQIGDATMLTREMGRAITIAYASPEQLLSEPITTASDVYSAGILFYELLCGKRPFAGRDQTMMSLLGVIDTTPPTPTSIVRGDEAIDVAQFGAVSRKALGKTLQGDLAAIAAKAIRRDLKARYASAAAFADDLRRHLNDQPVLAREGARLYALRKFFWRQRVPIAVATLGTLVAGGLGITSLQQYEAQRASAAQADAIGKFMGAIFQGMSPEVAENRKFTARELLDRATTLMPDVSVDAKETGVLTKIAELYSTIGEDEKSIELYEKQVAAANTAGLTVDEFGGLVSLAWTQMLVNKNDDAAKTLARADRIFATTAKLPAKHKTIYYYCRYYLAVRANRGTDAKQEARLMGLALKGWDEPESQWKIRHQTILAKLAERDKDYVAAEKQYDEIIEYSGTIGPTGQTHLLRGRANRARVWQTAGKCDLAERELPETIAALEKRYGDEDILALESRLVLARAQLCTGQMDAARNSAKHAYERATRNSKLRIAAAKIAIEATLHSGNTALAERQLTEYLGASQFEGIEAGLEGERQRAVRMLEAIAMLAKRKNAEALELLRAYKPTGTEATESEQRVAFLLAFAQLRLGALEEAGENFRAMIDKKSHAHSDEYDGALVLAQTYELATRFQERTLASKTRRDLERLFRESSEMQNLLSALDSKDANRAWHDFPFVFF